MDSNEAKQLVFGWIDYGLFSGLLGVSLLIGVYFGFFSKQDSTREYLFGGKTMNYVPVATSILASFLSGITFLGVPTEVYLHGSQYFLVTLAAILIGLISAYITLPVFHRLQVSSGYEYLELRFTKAARTLASILYTISLFTYIPIVVYVPALAFSQVTGYRIHAITPIFSLVCITYTSMGGVKAVVWTDTIQFIFTIGGLVAVLILGIISIGGLSEVWRIADEGGRIKFFELDPSPFNRDTVWAMTIGMTFSLLARFGLGQKFIQRFLAIEKESDMRKAIFLTSVGWGTIQIACVITGLVMYAQYHDCDPLAAKLVGRSDQTLPYFVMDIAGHIPGLPGIFLAGLVSSALSTMSASLNTLAATIYDTFINDWIAENPKKDAKAANIMKGISVIAGVITIGLIFIVEHLGTVFEMALSVSSAMEGALLGLFMVGLLVPWVGKKGAIAGACSSLVITGWLVGGTQWHILNGRIHYPTLPASVDSCPYPLNETLLRGATTTEKPLAKDEEPMILFHIAIMYFTLIGGVIVIVVALLTSYFTGEMDLEKVDPKHISPIARWLLPKKKFYIGVPINEIKLEKNDDNESAKTRPY